MASPRTALRRILASPELAVLPGVYDALTATLVERSGFPGAYMSGAAVSVALAGLPDLGLLTMTDMADQAGRIAGVLSIPLIADADTGFGNPLHVQRTVAAYEKAGVAGLHLEDQTFPKRCGHLAGKSVVPAAEFADKVRAAVEARHDPDLVIIARTDARGPLGWAAAIERSNLYLEAGADLIFVEAPETIDEVMAVPKEVGGPVMYNIVEGGRSPDVELSQLEEAGYALAIRPLSLIGPVAEAIGRTLASLGGSDPSGSVGSPSELFELVGLSRWLGAGNRFGSGSD